MFEYKTESELQAMTPDQRDKYATDKRKHEAGEVQKAIDEAIKNLPPAPDNKEEINALKAELEGYRQELQRIKETGVGANNVQKGKFIEFVEKQIADKNPERTPQYKGAFTFDAKELLEAVNKVAALMTTANVVPNVTSGFNQLFGNFIDSTIYSVPKPDTFILPLIDVTTQIGTESIWYVDRANQEGDAAFIGEGDAKPLADAEWLEKKAPVKEVALFWKFSKRLANNAPSVVTDFRVHANELVEQKIDDGIFAGDGTGNNLTGVKEAGVAYVVPTALAESYTEANIFDVIMATAVKIRLGNFKGQITAVLNTVWLAKMFAVKAEDTSGTYILPSFVAPDGSQVGEVNIVFSNKADADEIVIGILKNFKAVISQNVQYDEGYENDDFRKNLMSKKLEAFMGTYHPASLSGSIIVDDIATVLTAIEVPAV